MRLPGTASGAEPAAGTPGPADASGAAFFDVDNTMIMGASIYYFARGLAARHYFRSRDLVHFVGQQVAFRIVGAESPGGMADAKEAALAFVAGRPVEEIVGLCEEIYDELMVGRIWSGTRALAEAHLLAGQRVWLVTATPVELARIVSNRLGLTGALGTVAEIEDGVYTGRLAGDPLHGPAKAAAVVALAEREGLDLARCSAYSDSVNDLPMLSVVGHPTAVNPDGDLRRIARRRGWPVRDFRTGRKAAKIGVPSVAAASAVAGGVAVGLAARRRSGSVVRTSAAPPDPAAAPAPVGAPPPPARVVRAYRPVSRWRGAGSLAPPSW